MEWKEVTLGDLCEISSSKRIFAKEYQSDGVPFYRGKEIIAKQKGNAISNELFISRNRYEEIKARYGVPQQRELLLTSVGTLGVPYVIKEEEFYFKDGNLTWFRHFNGLDVEYLYYWFLSPYGKNEINTKAIGSTQKALTIDSLSKFDIKIPVNLDDQRRIASILSSLDRKIELNNKINADLEEMAQAIFKNWFVDFEPFKDGKFVDSELGMIPEGWKVGCLGDMGAVVCGKTPSKSNSNYYGGDIPFIKIPDMHGNVFVENSEDRLTEEGSLSQIKKLIPPYSLMVSCIATVGLVSINTKPSHTNQQINTVIPHNKSALFYLYQHIKNNEEFLKNMGRGGTTTLNVNTKSFSNIRLLIPSEIALEQFHGIVEGLFKKIEQNLHESRTLSLLRDTLLPRLMSGELEIPE